MKTLLQAFFIVLLAFNFLNIQKTEENPDFVILSNGIEVNNVESFDCQTVDLMQLCIIDFNFGETVITIADSEGYLAFDSEGGLVEF